MSTDNYKDIIYDKYIKNISEHDKHLMKQLNNYFGFNENNDNNREIFKNKSGSIFDLNKNDLFKQLLLNTNINSECEKYLIKIWKRYKKMIKLNV